MNFIIGSKRTACRFRRPTQSGFIKPKLTLFLAAVVIVMVGAFVMYRPTETGGATATQSKAGAGLAEVDFGFVELNPGLATPITSYKFGGSMVLYAGEEVRYQVVGTNPLPSIELRVGDSVHALSGPDGAMRVAGPANRPLVAIMFTQAPRYSLPGGAPPRISVKVQVHGPSRPKG